MKLAYISDQRFYCDSLGQWYTTASFPLDEFSKQFPFVRSWTIFGRLDVTPEKHSLYRIPMPGDVTVEFHGVFSMPTGLSGYLRNFFPYVTSIRRAVREADVVWFKTPFLASLIGWFFRRKGQVAVTHMVGDPVEPLARRMGSRWRSLGFVSAALLRRMYRSADVCAFVSMDLLNRYASRERKSMVINESRIGDALLRSKRIDPRPVSGRVLFVGRLSGEKDVATLVRACAQVSRDMPIQLNLVGDGPERETLRQLGVNEGVRTQLLGQVPWGEQLWAQYEQADVFVLPSRSEGMPLVLVEALSQGVPVVASRVGGIPEVITDDVSGLLVMPGDVPGFASAIKRILQEPSLRQHLVKNGLAIARNNTLESQISKLALAVRTALQQKSQ